MPLARLILLLAPLACASAPAPTQAPPDPCAGPHREVRFEVRDALPTPAEHPPTTATSTRLGGRFVISDPGRRELIEVAPCDGCTPRTLPFDGAPVRVRFADLDGEPELEWIIADIGILWPSEAKLGRVVVLDEGKPTVVDDGLGRVTCAEPGDLDGDGDNDLVVCEFGHLEGGLHWLEHTAEGWTRHNLHAKPGTNHALPADFDGDGDLDIAAIVSQQDEQVILYRNQGGGEFAEEVLFDSEDTDYGLAGLNLSDLDGDGDLDLLVTHGDTMDETLSPDVDPYGLHGVEYYENDGSGQFTARTLAKLWGAYGVEAADIDGDCDQDLLLVAYQVPTLFPNAAVRNAVWLENDGNEAFTMHDIPGAPPQTMSVSVGDANEDGRPDFLVGTLYMNGPDFGRRLAWLMNSPAAQ